MKIKVSDSASITKTITEADIQTFGDLTGDRNPLHLTKSTRAVLASANPSATAC